MADLFEVVAGQASPERCDPITARAVNASQRGIGALPQSAPSRCHNLFGHDEASSSGFSASFSGLDLQPFLRWGTVSELWYLSMLSREVRTVQGRATGPQKPSKSDYFHPEFLVGVVLNQMRWNLLVQTPKTQLKANENLQTA